MKNKRLDVAVPIYISNLCDSACSMCNMRKQNETLIRIDGNMHQIKEQLGILYYKEGVRWVMLLSGEYKEGEYRLAHMKRIVQVVNEAYRMGFEKVTVNIGALYDSEIEYFYQNMLHPETTGLAVFQETYNREVYQKKFGTYDPEIPKSNFDRRLTTPERWLQHGFRIVNLGILLGTGNPEEDVDSLIRHCKNLLIYDSSVVQISLPRIVQDHNGCSDEIYKNLIRKVKKEVPMVDIILTTREKEEFLEEVLPYFDVLSPGTSEVLGYTEKGEINNTPDKSQFFIARKRKRPSEVVRNFAQRCNVDFRFMEESKEYETKKTVFLSTPITNAVNPETGQYDAVMAYQIRRLAEKIRGRGYELFLAIEEEEWGKDIASPEKCTPRDYSHLQKATHLIVYLTSCFSEGTLVEIGWASAWKIPITILCQKGMSISPLVKGLNNIGDNKLFLVDFNQEEDINAILCSRL